MNKRAKVLVVVLSAVGVSVVGVFLIITVWMNLTPGYFQYGGCNCAVGYLTDVQADKERRDPICNLVGVCHPNFWDKPLLLATRLDFNRGDKASTPPPLEPYACPKTEWVNCMPILTPEAQRSCTKEYLDWAKENCPNFQGGAY